MKLINYNNVGAYKEVRSIIHSTRDDGFDLIVIDELLGDDTQNYRTRQIMGLFL